MRKMRQSVAIGKRPAHFRLSLPSTIDGMCAVATIAAFGNRQGGIALVALLAACVALASHAAPRSSAKPAHAAAAALTSSLGKAIDQYIAQPQFARADWGIVVRSLKSRRVVYQHNADRLFVPASNVKLFTAGLALAELGSDTRIATTLYATSTRVGGKGVLRGDLILYGRGDPSLGADDISADWAERMATAVAQLGVQRIEGNLIADATYFTGPPIGDGWEANDLQTWFGAAPSALSVQGNLIHVDITRSARTCCTVSVTPSAAGVQVMNQTDASNAVPLGLYRPLGASTLYALGTLAPGTRSHSYALAMPDPALAAGNLLRDALAQRGIMLAGKVTVLHWPESDPALNQPGTQAVASVTSPSIAALVDHTLKVSDNLYAQALLLQAGVAAAQRGDCSAAPRPDSSAGWALCALRGLLAKAGIGSDAVLLAEGAGLARRDLVTPNAFVRWLAWSKTQAWGPDLRNALPLAGVDGTLAHRFTDGAATDNLQAKTGTLSHDYSLTGFVTDAAGEPLVFSIMLNRYPRWEVEASLPNSAMPKQALDAIATLIAQHGAK